MENRRINYILATKPNTFETLHTLYLRLLLSLSAGTALAQTKTGSLHGVVVDSAQRVPLIGATVTVASLFDTVTVITDRQGAFSIGRIRDTLVRTRISYIGYRDFSSRVRIEPKGTRMDTVALGTADYQLEAAVVQGERPLMGQRGDTLIYHAEAIRVLPGDEYAIGAADARHGSQRRKDHRDGESRRTHLRRRQAAVRGKFRIGAAIPRSPRRDRYPGIRRAGRRGKNQNNANGKNARS